MKEQNNELATVNKNGLTMVQDNDSFTVYKDSTGKYIKEMKYKDLIVFPEDTEFNEVELFNLINGTSEKAVELKATIGTEILIKGFVTRAYESFDEETGQTSKGVTTTLYDGTQYFVTSSKTVYYNVINMHDVFGSPRSEGGFLVKVIGTKRQLGTQISLELKEVI